MIEKKQEEKIVWKDAKRVFFWYWKLTKKYSHWFGFSLAAYGIAAVTSQVYSTLILKHIVDIISASSSCRSSVSSEYFISSWGFGITKVSGSGKGSYCKVYF